MLKPQKIALEDSNIANLGTKLEKEVKRAAAETEDAWKGIGKAPGLVIWRIEKFKVVSWPKEEYGNFFSGDSYIVLHTFKKSQDSDALSHDVFFWLGSETTQDEAGTAAYKTVELDDVLGGAPVQHREVQGFESESFVKLFKTLRIMSGGVETGFKHVEAPRYKARLIQVKGLKESVVAKEVPLKPASLNSGDVFLLDCGLSLYQFNGKEASIAERLRGTQLARAISDERDGRTAVHTFDQGEEPAEFWATLGGKGPIAEASVGGDDRQVRSEKRLLQLTDGTEGRESKRGNLRPEPMGSVVPSVRPIGGFDAARDAEELKKSLGFFGTKTSAIVDILGTRSFQQRQEIKEAYQKLAGEDLVKRLEAKTSFNLKKTLLAMFASPVHNDVQALHKAIKGAGTDEACLLEILCNRSNLEIKAIKEAYRKEFNKELETEVAEDTSGDFKALLQGLLKGERESGGADEQRANQDAEALFKAGEARWGTDEETFVLLLTRRSLPHLLRVFELYQAIAGRTILESIERETSGDLREGLQSLVRCLICPQEYYQERLYRAMKGLGTNDETLMRIMVGRAEIDLASIALLFNQAHPEHTLAQMICADTSGAYQDLLLRLLGEHKPPPPAQKVLPKSLGGAGALPKLVVREVAVGSLSRSLLDPNDVFILDNGFEVIVWVGRGASKLEKKTSLQYAQDYLIAYGKPLHTPISRILDGGENEIFEASFDS